MRKGVSVRQLALGAALVGGIALVAHLYVDSAALAWGGRGLLAVAVALAGATLGRQAWLQAVCAAGAVALAGSLHLLLIDLGPRMQVEAVVGGLATLVVGVLVMRPTPARPTAPPSPSPSPSSAPSPAPSPARPGNHRH
ncbi:hypothetical protein [Nocardioides litoris]|uniref:hypothetical protein n=1 Tax=Nocardioides litoris TaxID=1926648 RepID=UPI00112165AE|nr:hypothetical protein [Nocardioides litoris]